MRGQTGVNAETSLLGTCFNLARMITILGVSGLIEKLMVLEESQHLDNIPRDQAVPISKEGRTLSAELLQRPAISILLSKSVYIDLNIKLSFYSAEVKNFPESKFAHNNLGTKLTDHKEAIVEFRKALELDSLYIEPRYNLANRYAKLNLLKEKINSNH
jgi:hypothetical protein